MALFFFLLFSVLPSTTPGTRWTAQHAFSTAISISLAGECVRTRAALPFITECGATGRTFFERLHGEHAHEDFPHFLVLLTVAYFCVGLKYISAAGAFHTTGKYAALMSLFFPVQRQH